MVICSNKKNIDAAMEAFRDLIDAMATQLNTTTEFMIEILVLQIMIEAAVGILIGFGSAILILVAAGQVKTSITAVSETDEARDLFSCLFWGTVGLFSGGGIINFLGKLEILATQLFNPEYAAVVRVIEFISAANGG